MNTYSCTECSADQLALRHALGDEIDIRQAGLWDRYCADLEHSRRRVYPPERTRGPLSRLHGERWAAEYQATMRQRDRLVWILACDFAREHDVTIQAAMREAAQAIDDVLTRVRTRWATVARLLLCGVAVALPAAAEPADEPPASAAAPAPMPVVTVMGAAR